MAQATAPILDSTECDIARSRMDVRFSGEERSCRRTSPARPSFEPRLCKKRLVSCESRE